MNFFQIYIGQIHLFSLVSVCLVILIGMVLIRKHPIHISMIMSLIMVLLGHYVYEDIFIQIMGLTGRSTSAGPLFVLVTGLIVASIMALNGLFPFLKLDGLLVTVLLFLSVSQCFVMLWSTGWFHSLQLWYTGNGPDPHNALWALSKILGFSIFIPLLWRKSP